MEKLIILLCVVILFLLFKTYYNRKCESFSQDFYPHQYASNIIPCSSNVKKV
jgi:hypothetical protein